MAGKKFGKLPNRQNKQHARKHAVSPPARRSGSMAKPAARQENSTLPRKP
ncbi:MAG: hypothetical protein JXQ83_07440 [Candidatus Glassbacteria bacterium]|nr:hypothetical protein [Candidatus Glassbacteria bacterium]